MKRRLAIIAGLILAACGGGAVTKEVLRYDFGSVAAGGGGAVPRVSLAMVDVQAASWLSGPDMHFRLAYAEPLQRRSYSESRWAAPRPSCWMLSSSAGSFSARPRLLARAAACRSCSTNWNSASMSRRAARWYWKCAPN